MRRFVCVALAAGCFVSAAPGFALAQDKPSWAERLKAPFANRRPNWSRVFRNPFVREQSEPAPSAARSGGSARTMDEPAGRFQRSASLTGTAFSTDRPAYNTPPDGASGFSRHADAGAAAAALSQEVDDRELAVEHPATNVARRHEPVKPAEATDDWNETQSGPTRNPFADHAAASTHAASRARPSVQQAAASANSEEGRFPGRRPAADPHGIPTTRPAWNEDTAPPAKPEPKPSDHPWLNPPEPNSIGGYGIPGRDDPQTLRYDPQALHPQQQSFQHQPREMPRPPQSFQHQQQAMQRDVPPTRRIVRPPIRSANGR